MNSAESQSSAQERVTIAMGVRDGPYRSERTVPAATRMASVSERRTWNTSESALPPSPPDLPATSVAPSTLAIMLTRTEGRDDGGRQVRRTAPPRSTGSTTSGRSWRTVSDSAAGPAPRHRVAA